MESDLSAFLLNLDGTLTAFEPGILSSCRAALRSLGHEADLAIDVASIIGPPIEDAMRLPRLRMRRGGSMRHT